METKTPPLTLNTSVEIKKEGNFKTVEMELSSEKDVVLNVKACISQCPAARIKVPPLGILQDFLSGIESASAHISITFSEPEVMQGFAEAMSDKFNPTPNA